MSSKIPKNLSPNDGPSASDPDADEPIEQPEVTAQSSGRSPGNLPDDNSEMELDDESDSEDFSLDKLSQAYARVLKGSPAEFNSVGVAGEQPPGNNLGSKVAIGPNRTVSAFSRDQEPTEPAIAIDDNAACPLTPESIVEAILFVGTPAGVKLTTRMIAAVLRDVSPKEISKIIKQLNERYVNEQAAYRIKTIDGGLKLELDDSLTSFQQEFFGRNKAVKLSQAAIEVLAIVAYNQPVTREQIDKLRAKPSGGILSQLTRRELLTILIDDKKSAEQQFVTTNKFLDFFHLTELHDLPQSHEVSDLDELAD